MTVDEAQKYFSQMAIQAKIEIANVSDLVNQAIGWGVGEFWNARPWRFRVKTGTLVIAAEADSYDLPEDFGQYLSLRDIELSTGNQIRFMTKAEFDYHFPRLDSESAGVPRFCTIYEDLQESKSKIQFFPCPTTRTIYIAYLTKTGAINVIPDRYSGGLRATIEKYLYPTFTEKFQAASVSCDSELNTLERLDTANGAPLFKFFDDTDYPQSNASGTWSWT